MIITGKVRNREAAVDLDAGVSASTPVRIEAIVDTGYNGYLTLPPAIVKLLQCPFAGHRRAKLADGSEILLDVYLATIDWRGQPRNVLISQADGTPLLGMSMLHGNRLTMDVIDGGAVVIEELRQPP